VLEQLVELFLRVGHELIQDVLDVLVTTVDQTRLQLARIENQELLVSSSLLVAHIINVLTNRLDHTLVSLVGVLVRAVVAAIRALLQETFLSTLCTHRLDLFYFRSVLPRSALGLHIVLDVLNDLSDVC